MRIQKQEGNRSTARYTLSAAILKILVEKTRGRCPALRTIKVFKRPSFLPPRCCLREQPHRIPASVCMPPAHRAPAYFEIIISNAAAIRNFMRRRSRAGARKCRRRNEKRFARKKFPRCEYPVALFRYLTHVNYISRIVTIK